MARSAVKIILEDEGWISSTAYSPHLGKLIALGFLKRGNKRMDKVIKVANPLGGQSVEARVVSTFVPCRKTGASYGILCGRSFAVSFLHTIEAAAHSVLAILQVKAL